MAVFLVVIGGLLLVSLIFLIWGAGLKSKEPDYRTMVAETDKEVAQQKAAFVEELAHVMRQEFPDAAAKISVVSLDGFYDFSNNWIYAHRAKGKSVQAARKKSVEDTGFRQELRKRLAELFPEEIAAVAKSDFEAWIERMDRIIKVSMERALPNMKLSATAIYK